MMARQPHRYEFMVPAPVQLGRYWSAFLVGSSMMLALLVHSVIWSPILVLFATGGVFGLLRPAEPGWYVELRDDGVIVNMLTRRKIAYSDISTAGFYVYRHNAVVRSLANASIAFGRLFGGQSTYLRRAGEIDRDSAELRFGRVLWVYLPFPPFLLPSRSLWLKVENPSRLLSELDGRLPARTVQR